MGRGGEVREQFFVTIFASAAYVSNIQQHLSYIVKVLIPMYKHTKSRMLKDCA
jgi:hypothetical protein